MFTDPEQNINHLHLREGYQVADLGAGIGAYSFAAARKIGKSGKVYAVEVQKDLVSKIRNGALGAKLENVEVLWGDVEEKGGSKIADNVVDAVIISNILFQTEDKDGLLAETNRILKSGGKILVVEWSESFSGLGPQPEHVVQKAKAKHLFGGAGFALEEEFDAGEHHYGFVFTKV
ncbi:methyltransferase domain-containing protein [Patescibacteria group bacterium]